LIADGQAEITSLQMPHINLILLEEIARWIYFENDNHVRLSISNLLEPTKRINIK